VRRLGVLLLLVGASEFVLPHVVFKLFGAYRWHGAIALIAAGAGLVLLSLRRPTKNG
jgi:hypothetical protein